jgi:hypothetical protein
MHGSIIFENEEALAKFLVHFTGSTALFEVQQLANEKYQLKFTGGY